MHFQYALYRSSCDEKIGITLITNRQEVQVPDGSAWMEIQRIEENDLVGRKNRLIRKEAEFFPLRWLEVGDYIVNINGHSNQEKMREELSRATALHMTIRRDTHLATGIRATPSPPTDTHLAIGSRAIPSPPTDTRPAIGSRAIPSPPPSENGSQPSLASIGLQSPEGSVPEAPMPYRLPPQPCVDPVMQEWNEICTEREEVGVVMEPPQVAQLIGESEGAAPNISLKSPLGQPEEAPPQSRAPPRCRNGGNILPPDHQTLLQKLEATMTPADLEESARQIKIRSEAAQQHRESVGQQRRESMESARSPHSLQGAASRVVPPPPPKANACYQPPLPPNSYIPNGIPCSRSAFPARPPLYREPEQESGFDAWSIDEPPRAVGMQSTLSAPIFSEPPPPLASRHQIPQMLSQQPPLAQPDGRSLYVMPDPWEREDPWSASKQKVMQYRSAYQAPPPPLAPMQEQDLEIFRRGGVFLVLRRYAERGAGSGYLTLEMHHLVDVAADSLAAGDPGDDYPHYVYGNIHSGDSSRAEQGWFPTAILERRFDETL